MGGNAPSDRRQAVKRSKPLSANPERVAEFQQRGRESSARSLRAGAHSASGGTRPRRRRISPATDAQRATVAGMACLGCGREASEYVAIDPAHLWPRGRGGCDGRYCTVPLCRTFAGEGCHREFDEGRLDLLSRMTATWEQWRPWVQHALRHCTLVELLERLTGARTQWSEPSPDRDLRREER